MVYPVSEIFYSLQGEGYWTGRAAIFLRLWGCNLKCPWCDTHVPPRFYCSADEVVKAISHQIPHDHSDILVVITGGEPTIHKYAELVTALHTSLPMCMIAMETNGTNLARPVLQDLRQSNILNWITVSPKLGVQSDEIIESYFVDSKWCGDELKVVLDPNGDIGLLRRYGPMLRHRFRHLYIQPLSEDFQPAVKFVKENPLWRLSVQMHKVISIA